MTQLCLVRNLALLGAVAIAGYSTQASAAWAEPTDGWQLNYDLSVTSSYPDASWARTGYTEGDPVADPRANIVQDDVTNERVLSLVSSTGLPNYRHFGADAGAGTNADLITVDFRLRLTDENIAGNQFQIFVARPGPVSGEALYLLNFSTTGINVLAPEGIYSDYAIDLSTDWHDFRWHIDVAGGSSSLYVDGSTEALLAGVSPFTDSTDNNQFQFGANAGNVNGSVNLSYIRLTNNELVSLVPEPVSMGLLAMGGLLLMRRRGSRRV